MNPRLKSIFYFTPRVLSIIMVLFLMLFSLDVFDTTTNIQELLIGLVIHNVPAIILLVASIFAWKHELIGVAIYYLGAVFYAVIVFDNQLNFFIQLSWIATISLPLIIIGTLYLISYMFISRNKRVKAWARKLIF